MDTSRERGPEEGTSIRLRYSRQFQSGGHAHSIDAEAMLPVGANQEKREQVIRELESGVEHLARQIAQRAARSTGEARPQAPARPVAASSSSMAPASGQSVENAALPALPMQKPATGPQPAAHAPISESMPATPARSSEGGTVKLAQFINAIKKRWDMSLKDAMELLHVTTLEGMNLREAYTQLQTIIEAKNAPQRSNQQPRITQAPPIVEAPRQENRSAPQQSPSRFPPNPAPPNSPGPRAQSPIALKEVSRSAPPTIPVNTPLPEPSSLSEVPRGLEAGVDFAGSPKAPLPIKLATVRDISARNSYKFEEEEDEEEDGEYELPDNDDLINLRAQSKLDELKTVRGSNAASAERLTVLNNVTDGLVSEANLLKLIKGIWGHTTPKKLKTTQVEKLISWAKEDDFAAEVEAVLDLLAAEEGE